MLRTFAFFAKGGVGNSLLPVSVARCSWPGKQQNKNGGLL